MVLNSLARGTRSSATLPSSEMRQMRRAHQVSPARRRAQVGALRGARDARARSRTLRERLADDRDLIRLKLLLLAALLVLSAMLERVG